MPLVTAARSVPKPGGKPCEDHHAVDHARGLVAVADGLGQYTGGAEASALAVAEVLAALAGEPPESAAEVKTWLGRALTCAARALHARGRKEPRLGSMATTLTLARLDLEGGTLDVVHVGDARAYRLRGGALEQLTRAHSIAWEQVEAANWDRDSETLRISEVGSWGQQRREYAVVLPEPTRLVELVRERVIASVVVQQFVPIEAGKGLRVIGRRAPRGTRPITWLYEYDEGIDPADSAVVAAASQALERIRLDLGLG